jgi:hypothetical protein
VTKKLFIYGVIAPREAIFFNNTIREKGAKDIILSFCEPANELIDDSETEIINFYDEVKLHQNERDVDTNLVKQLTELELNNDNLTLHEKVTFGIKSDQELFNKFNTYYRTCYSILKNLKNKYLDHQINIIQELGGFVAPYSLYLASQKLDIDHYFLEPSMFKGRNHFLKNTMSPPDTRRNYQDLSEEEQKLLKKALIGIAESRSPIVPEKDQHHFLDMSLKKLINNETINKLTFKIKAKYLKNQKQEYEHVYHHCYKYFKMYRNRKKINPYYTNASINQLKTTRTLYFPFHVQLDFALTVRSPKYLDQLKLLKEILRTLPKDITILAKEHPASIGGFPANELINIIKNHKNFHLIHPSTNNFELLDIATDIVTINSKAGIEGYLLEKNVYMLGDAFYKYFPGIICCKNISDLAEAISKNAPIKQDSIEKSANNNERLKHFEYLWKHSYPFELYNNDIKNIQKFNNSLQLL